MRDSIVTMLHYELVEEYRRQQYKDLLLSNHVASDKLHINKVTFPGGLVNDEYDFWGYILEKDGDKYLLSCMTVDGEELSLKDLLPIYPEDLEEVAYRGQAYKVINRPVPARIPPEKKLSFKEFVDNLSYTKHTNKDHQIFNVLLGLTQRFYRAYFRVCTPPGFGKDSFVSVMDALVGGCGSITNPTVAKLEYMTYLNHLVINEVSSIGKSEWALIQQFLLDVGDFKPSTFKRSRGDREVIDLTNLSISLFYNDIDQYASLKKFFDTKTDGNVKDRFVPFRFVGGYDEPFENITKLNTKSFIKDNFVFYRDIVSSYYYYKENLEKYVDSSYPSPDLSIYPKRWRNNLSWVIKMLNVYSDDEVEYLRLWGNLKSCIKDYEEMLKYPEYFRGLMDKLRVPPSVYGEGVRLPVVIDFLTAKAKSNDRHKDKLMRQVVYLKKILAEPLFANKNVMCGCYSESTVSPNKEETLKW